jgi:hypothetical protein
MPDVRPQIVGRPVREGQVATVYLAPRFATAIRMPDAVNSVVLGDPESFSAEHSEREPQIVFVKPITPKPAQTNLLISTARGYQANLLLISRGETRGSQARVDFVVRYRPAGRFIIEPSTPSVSVAQTAALSAQDAKPVPAGATQAAFREPSVTGWADGVTLVEADSRAAMAAAGNGTAHLLGTHHCGSRAQGRPNRLLGAASIHQLPLAADDGKVGVQAVHRGRVHAAGVCIGR